MSRWLARVRGLSPTAVDVVLTVLALAAQSAPFLFTVRSDGRPWTVVEFAPVLLVALPVVWRRRAPLVCLLITAIGITAYSFVGGHGPEQPVWYGALVVMYTVADQASRRSRMVALVASAVGIVLIAGMLGSVAAAVREGFLWGAAYALGRAARVRRADQAERAVREERARIARDTHDILAHAVSVMVVQAEAGPVVLRSDPARAEAAFAAVTNKMAATGIGGSITRAFPVTWHRMIADAGLFGGGFHDPVPVLRNVKQPVLGLWGERDTVIPPAETAKLVAATLTASGNTHYVLRFVPNAEHALHQRGQDREWLPALMPGYADTVGAWVRDVTAGHVPAEHVDPLPTQERTSVDASQPAWWESAPVQFGAIGVFLILFGAYPLVAVVRRFRGRGTSGTGSARVLAGAGLFVPLGMTGYLSVLMFTMTDYTVQAGPLLGNRPVVWLVLQAFAVAATVATVLLARGWRGSTDRLRHGLLLAGGALFIPWALYWGLLLP